MADSLTEEQRSRCMSAIRGKNTGPERLVRSVLHSLGCRFSLHRSDLPGKPDIVMPARRTIVLVHGCYWHSHHCRRGKSTPTTNAEFWKSKRGATIVRDRRNLTSLRRAGWKVVVVWECETRKKAILKNRFRQMLLTQQKSYR